MNTRKYINETPQLKVGAIKINLDGEIISSNFISYSSLVSFLNKENDAFYLYVTIKIGRAKREIGFWKYYYATYYVKNRRVLIPKGKYSKNFLFQWLNQEIKMGTKQEIQNKVINKLNENYKNIRNLIKQVINEFIKK